MPLQGSMDIQTRDSRTGTLVIKNIDLEGALDNADGTRVFFMSGKTDAHLSVTVELGELKVGKTYDAGELLKALY